MKSILILLLIVFSRICAAEVLPIQQGELLSSITEKDQQFVVIDIRTPREYQSGHIPGAINIPHDQIIENISLLDPYLDKKVVLHCEVGGRVKRTLSHLDSGTFNKLYHLQGDMRGWRSEGLPQEK